MRKINKVIIENPKLPDLGCETRRMNGNILNYLNKLKKALQH